MKSFPEGVQPYKRTDVFTEDTVPAKLQNRHNTKAGTWAKIVVLEGSLRYRILSDPPEEHTLSPEHPGVVEPTTPHEVAPLGPVRFFVEFYRIPGDNNPGEPLA